MLSGLCKKFVKSCVAASVLLLLGTASATAAVEGLSGFGQEALDEINAWHITSQNTLYYDYYDSHGNDFGSRFRYDGSQVYSEHYTSFDRRFSDYENVRGSVSQIINSSDYRSSQQGWHVEDLRLTWEKGDAAIPFRFDFGDLSANFSQRTVQQSLKGLQLEMQPDWKIGSAEQRHSIIAFSGMNQRILRDVQVNRDLFSGLSWLVDMARYGTWAFHVVHNYRDNRDDLGLAQREQVTWSMTFQKAFKVLTQTLNLEAEVAKFMGDYESFRNSSGVEEDKSDTGIFLNLQGSSDLPLTYGFRYETYGDDFQPHGSTITPNRRTFAWNAGWAFDSGLRLDGRAELYRNDLESVNHIDRDVYGLTFSGPVENPWLDDLNIYADYYRESQNDVNRFTNVTVHNYRLSLDARLYKQWGGGFNFSGQHIKDQAFPSVIIPRQYGIEITHPLKFWGATGVGGTEVTFRNVSSSFVESTEYGQEFFMSLSKGVHRLNLSAEVYREEARTPNSDNVISANFDGSYELVLDTHRFAFDFEIHDRNPNAVKPTQDYRFGLRYTFAFDKPAGADIRDFSFKDGYKRAPVAPLVERAVLESDASSTLDWFNQLAPGKLFSLSLPWLENARVTGHERSDGVWVYEKRLFADIAARQRLVIQVKDDVIQNTAWLIDLNEGVDAHEAEEIYHRIQNRLLTRFGNPSANLEEGDFASYRADILNGSLKRVTEWDLTQGRMRFGLPQRLDQKVRIEIQYADNFPPLREGSWSLESLR